jgi:glycosyltransferase involved in cell wall biosynthesis
MVRAGATNLSLWHVPGLVVSSWGKDVVWDSGRKPALRDFWVRFLLRQAKAITSTSEFLARVTAKFAPKGSQIRIIPFGVDWEAFSSQHYRTTEPNGSVTIGFVKALEPKYGPEYLLRAFAEVSSRHKDARLLMVGKGSLLPSLRELAAELGVAERVEFPGAVALASMNVFAMASIFDSESFGVAALEASAMELPVIASRVGGVPEVVVDGETGVLVPPRDTGALVRALEELISDPDRGKRMGKAGRELVLSRYTWEKSVDAMEEVYSGVIEGRK